MSKEDQPDINQLSAPIEPDPMEHLLRKLRLLKLRNSDILRVHSGPAGRGPVTTGDLKTYLVKKDIPG
jgi:hypothetical protein